jgi:hypothetical protein
MDVTAHSKDNDHDVINVRRVTMTTDNYFVTSEEQTAPYIQVLKTSVQNDEIFLSLSSLCQHLE